MNQQELLNQMKYEMTGKYDFRMPFVALAILFTVFTGESFAVTEASVASSTTAVFGPAEDVTILSTDVDTDDDEELIIQVTSECGIALLDADPNIALDAYVVQVALRVEVDGEPVPVDPVVGDSGTVVFCSVIGWELKFVNAFDLEVQLNATTSSNAFNWYTSGLSEGTHTVDVIANIVETDFDDPDVAVKGAVRNRSLIVESIWVDE